MASDFRFARHRTMSSHLPLDRSQPKLPQHASGPSEPRLRIDPKLRATQNLIGAVDVGSTDDGVTHPPKEVASADPSQGDAFAASSPPDTLSSEDARIRIHPN